MKKQTILILLTIALLTTCGKSGALKVENAPIIYSELVNDMPVTLNPLILIDSIKSDPVIIGNIKDGKLNISFPDNLDNGYFFIPEESGYIATKGLKIAVFYPNPLIFLIKENMELSEAIEINYAVYSNKKGEMTRESEETILKKGWNIFTINDDSGLEIFNSVELQKEGYKWFCYDRN